MVQFATQKIGESFFQFLKFSTSSPNPSLLNGSPQTKFPADIKLNSRDLASAISDLHTQGWEVHANNGLILRLNRYFADFQLDQKSANHFCFIF